MNQIYITSAGRTAVGAVNQTLKNVSSIELGSEVILTAIKKLKIKDMN